MISITPWREEGALRPQSGEAKWKLTPGEVVVICECCEQRISMNYYPSQHQDTDSLLAMMIEYAQKCEWYLEASTFVALCKQCRQAWVAKCRPPLRGFDPHTTPPLGQKRSCADCVMRDICGKRQSGETAARLLEPIERLATLYNRLAEDCPQYEL